MISVLAIDDSETFRRQLRDMFARYDESRGCSLQTLDALPAPGEGFLERPDPDVILLDLGLPHSGGADTVRRARRIWPTTPIIVVTAGDINGETLEIKAAGASNVFSKTDVSTAMGFRVLLAAIKRALVDAGNVAAETTLTRTMNKIDMEPVVEHFDKKVKNARRLIVGLISLFGTLGTGGAYAWQTLHDIEEAPPEKQVEAPAWFKTYEARQAQVTSEIATKAAEAAGVAKEAADDVKDLDGRLRSLDRSLGELNGYLRGVSGQPLPAGRHRRNSDADDVR